VRGSPLSRRSFLQGTAAAAVATVAAPLALTSPVGASSTVRVTPLSRSTFAPLVNATLRMSNGLRSHKIVLADIAGLPNATPADDEHCFSLLFEAPAGSALPQAVRGVSHARIDTVHLLMVPVDRGKKHQYYQAIINSPRATVKNPA
jgi:hypothetical protein